MTRLQRILEQLDMLFAYYLLATEGSMKERVLLSAIEEWQIELGRELANGSRD